MFNNAEAYRKLKTKIVDRWPDIKIKHKQDYDFWKKLPIERQYSSSAIMDTIWMGTESFAVLAHEAKHQERIQKEGKLKFYAKYAFPQIIGGMLTLLSIPFFFFSVIAGLIPLIAGLLMFLPLPSPTRADIELDAYTLELAIEYWVTGKISEYSKSKIYNALTSTFYYKMIWDDEEAWERIESQCYKITAAPKRYAESSYLNWEVYKICKGE